MNPKWLKLAGEMLAEYADRLSNDGCNDWEWPADWTKADRLEFAKAIEADNCRKTADSLTRDELAEAKRRAASDFGPGNSAVARFLSTRVVGGS